MDWLLISLIGIQYLLQAISKGGLFCAIPGIMATVTLNIPSKPLPMLAAASSTSHAMCNYGHHFGRRQKQKFLGEMEATNTP